MYLPLSSSSTNISSENNQPRLSLLKPCRLTPRYILLALFATIVFIYLAAPRLDFNNHVAYILGNSVFNSPNLPQLISGGQATPVKPTKSIQEQTTTKLDTRCDPIDRKFVQYSVVFDGVKYPKALPLYKNKSINFECLRENKAKKKILAWNAFFGDWTYAKPFSHGCPVTNCEMTGDRKSLSTADMVLIHMRDSINPPPATRPSFQRWIFVLYESPIHSGDFTQYNGFFNATSTYRLDSEYSYFYEGSSYMHWTPNATFNEKHDFYAAKKRFATAVIRNCGASSRRIDYIGEMQKYVEVDVFGHCGKPCPTKYSDSSKGNCKEILGTEYKFYLAFENSICEDYITEKFFYILRHPIIPVVYGGGNYEHYVGVIFKKKFYLIIIF